MSVINSVPLIAAGDDGYQISRSVRLRSSASAYFNRTPASAGNQKTWTWSGWVKRGALGTNQTFFNAGNNGFVVRFNTTTDYLEVYNYSGAYQLQIITSQVFRDPSAWYHIVVVLDTTQATSSNRAKVYVNGSQVTSFGTATYPSQNADLLVNGVNTHAIGVLNSVGQYFDGYLTEVNFVDGQALTPASFGETDVLTGVWKPKRYAGTYGTNGFYLNFSDNSAATAAAIGKDYSGNGNNWTPNNISVTAGVTYDSMLDVPTMWADGGNGRGNYCTLNPLQPASTTVVVPTEGNLRMTGTASGNNVTGTMAIVSAAYFEGTVTTGGGTIQFGIKNLDTGNTYAYDSNGNKYLAGTGTAYGATFTTNDIIGVAVDPVNLTLQFYKNGTSQGVISSAFPAGNYVPFFYASNTNASVANFGQRPFAYTPPTGFKALNTQNLPDATIKKGNAYFDVTLWTGDGTSPRTIGSLAFQPDFIWTKRRSSGTANPNHWLFDSARGAGSNSLLTLESNLTTAEFDGKGGSGNATAITASGFTITGGTSNNNNLNESGSTFAAWNWKESASAGFDIVTFTKSSSSQTVNHSLGVTPAMMIVKGRGPSASNWLVYHKNANASPQNGGLAIEQTSAFSANAGYWNNTSPTSTQFTVGSFMPNENSVAYLFAEVAGFSKFGSYTGNGSADGPFVYCGFRPKFVMFKRTDTTGDWVTLDASRDTYNAAANMLYPNLSNAETNVGAIIDFLSNGFKLRFAGGASVNASGGTYIYACFAENPFKNSLAR